MSTTEQPPEPEQTDPEAVGFAEQPGEETAYDPATGEQVSGPGIETERSAEVTTESGTEIAHAEQTSIEKPPEEESDA
jgi:hypothetical protein